jgi:hypothetical protein
MQSYEKLGVFYLGRRHDLERKQTTPEPLLYESKHLVTHGFVVGMTGSGKTGLCVDLIEEAAIDGIPALVIDPKGDLGNLLLTFPELRPEDFEPWVSEDEVSRRGITRTLLAAEEAERWRRGLAVWDQEPERIVRLRAASEFTLYTPGSTAGTPVSILKSFAVPPPEVMEDAELLRERVGSTVAGLLGLTGIEADPVRSRESILLANLLQHAWAEGRDLDLAGLIQAVQSPPVQRVGVLEIESFFPAKDRFDLALRLNHLLASPAFANWAQGEPLDIGQLLYTRTGKPRVAIFSLAHLGEAERMFFVTLLLNQVLGWMRGQSGTTSLRALVYMDETFGYFPPVANPPAKQPLLKLLKQARAYGVGVVLATQNPVDLDYKGLANIGTWFIGRLQTDRDKARLLDGLEGAVADRGAPYDRATLERLLSGLGNRVFLLHNVHEDGWEIFESRWAMSYLRGPLSRAQIKALTAGGGEAPPPGPPTRDRAAIAGAPTATARPVLPPEVPQFFAPVRGSARAAGTIFYQPRLLGAAQVRYSDARLRINVATEVAVMTEIADSAIPVNWTAAEELAVAVSELENSPTGQDFAPLAPAASQVRNYAVWSRDFISWLQNERSLKLWRSPSLQLVSQPEEDERAFRVRLQQVARERRDAAAEKLRQKFAPKLAALQERLRRAEAAREREAQQASRAKMNTMISLGSTLLGAFLGRRAISTSTVGRAATTMRSASRAMEQSADVSRAADTVEAVQQQLRELEAQFAAETAAVGATLDPGSEALETMELRANRTQIQVRLVALVWLPFQRDAAGQLTPAY